MNYHNIKHDDMLNGDGFRVVLFVSGCSLRCKNCQNPQTWDRFGGIPFDENAKAEIFEELKKDYVSGITLTGGHPLEHYNVDELTILCKEIKQKFPTKTIWLYTGFVFEDVLKDYKNGKYPLLDYVDIIVDGPYIERLRDLSLKWRGSSNQRVIDFKETLKQNKTVKTLADVKALSTALTTEIDPALLAGSVIVTNQDGYAHIASNVDGNSVAYLQPDLSKPKALYVDGVPVIVFSNSTLKTVSKKAPIFYGNLAIGASFVDAGTYQFAYSAEAGFTKKKSDL